MFQQYSQGFLWYSAIFTETLFHITVHENELKQFGHIQLRNCEQIHAYLKREQSELWKNIFLVIALVEKKMSFSPKSVIPKKKKWKKLFLKCRRNHTTKYSFAFIIYSNNEHLHKRVVMDLFRMRHETLCSSWANSRFFLQKKPIFPPHCACLRRSVPTDIYSSSLQCLGKKNF